MLTALAVVFICPTVLLTGYLLYRAVQTGYSWDECDWDGNGRTSLFEPSLRRCQTPRSGDHASVVVQVLNQASHSVTSARRFLSSV